jgi:hypothetical protein
MEPVLWSNEYFQDQINRVIKHQINLSFYIRLERNPTKEEYEEWFEKFKNGALFAVTDYDLGIFND